MLPGIPESEVRFFVDQAYPELRRMAAGFVRGERPGATLQPTVLVHEAFLRLDEKGSSSFTSRNHFLATAARAMREVLVDRARNKNAAKRDASLFPPQAPEVIDYARMLAIDTALRRLSEIDPRQAQIVELRFFAGMTAEEIADHTGVSLRTVRREWATARVWLRRELSRIVR